VDEEKKTSGNENFNGKAELDWASLDKEGDEETSSEKKSKEDS